MTGAQVRPRKASRRTCSEPAMLSHEPQDLILAYKPSKYQ
jgi:hypothetical protein